MKKILYIPLCLIIGLIGFLIWLESDNDIYYHEVESNINDARGVKKEKQEEFKLLNPSKNLIPLGENNDGK
ncbi:hypothetical protein N9O82_00980 [Methylophilaceae bacterium]|jgi:hypothetical protein|nr:hypothetical protein [Methylophilaceae bacterium]MDC0977351.1 hypothetical protein [Methylophilaceae bacterium]